MQMGGAHVKTRPERPEANTRNFRFMGSSANQARRFPDRLHVCELQIMNLCVMPREARSPFCLARVTEFIPTDKTYLYPTKKSISSTTALTAMPG